MEIGEMHEKLVDETFLMYYIKEKFHFTLSICCKIFLGFGILERIEIFLGDEKYKNHTYKKGPTIKPNLFRNSQSTNWKYVYQVLLHISHASNECLC